MRRRTGDILHFPHRNGQILICTNSKKKAGELARPSFCAPLSSSAPIGGYVSTCIPAPPASQMCFFSRSPTLHNRSPHSLFRFPWTCVCVGNGTMRACVFNKRYAKKRERGREGRLLLCLDNRRAVGERIEEERRRAEKATFSSTYEERKWSCR